MSNIREERYILVILVYYDGESMTDKSNSQHDGKGGKRRQARGRIIGNGGFHSFPLLSYLGCKFVRLMSKSG